ncbi:hypothetical protein ACFQBO_28625, partial [Paenibacillus vulneris]|uniref:hypothetical protein n=1 Tax=Paenibacillus vulneris TaxID=1133364 RepID=UPI00362360D0
AWLLYAQLTQSYRDEYGNPRHRIVKHLGSIREERIQGVGSRYNFWRSVGTALDTLSLDSADRQRIETKIAEKVPKLTDKESEQRRKDAEALWSIGKEIRDGIGRILS